MIGILSTEVMLALAVAAIALLTLVAVLFPRKPKRAEKWEKAEIMKQLLALSDQEEKDRAAQAMRVRTQAPLAKPAMQSANIRMRVGGKSVLPARAKSR